MEKEELDKILENHQHYLNQDIAGWENMRANLRGANLSYTDLRNANLSYADLSEANLKGADLRYTYLLSADISKADLRDVNISHANLNFADLRNANLSYANLRNASLQGADLSYAEISCSILVSANLQDTDFKCATLAHSNLGDSDLRGANLKGADIKTALFEDANLNCTIFDKKEEYHKGVALSHSIIGWKKCDGNVIVELEIPKGAVVFCINGWKCRTNKCKVISLSKGDIAYSFHDNSFTYEVGKEIDIEDFNMMYNIECASGIHFFKTREEAENYKNYV